MHEPLILSSLPAKDLVSEIARQVCATIAAQPKGTTDQPEDLLTPEQVGQLLGVTLPTVRGYTRDGQLVAYRIGSRVRYKRSEVIGNLQRVGKRKTPAR